MRSVAAAPAAGSVCTVQVALQDGPQPNREGTLREYSDFKAQVSCAAPLGEQSGC